MGVDMEVPGKLNITVYRGKTYSLPTSKRVAGIPVNFSSKYTKARMQVRPSFLQIPDAVVPHAMFELTTENGRIEMSGEVLTIKISSVDSASLSFDQGVYDIELIDDKVSPPIVDPYLVGSFEVEGEATVNV